MRLPFLIFSDKSGKIYSHPFLMMAGTSLNNFSIPKENELLKLPRGSSLFYLPHRIPIGFNPDTKSFEPLFEFKGKKVFSVGAFLIPAYLRLYNPAYSIKQKTTLPLWAYSACGFYRGNFYVAGLRVDSRVRQSPRFYDNSLVRHKVKEFSRLYPQNRLYAHLANCALNYNCLAAKNLFLERWEAPLPTSRFCNARCIGCLSHQESDCLSSHQRINFRPTPEEIVQVILHHFQNAKEAITSFGQGCEGEPLLEEGVITEAISKVREKTARGTINMNTNASIPQRIELLCKAGIDSFRVSLNSPQEKFYNLYFKPRGYRFADVLKSIAIAKKHNKFVSINLFVFPGFSDSQEEIGALIKFIKNTGIDMIQWRNLNIDPDYYLRILPYKKLKPQGILLLLKTIKKQFPYLKMGYFNLPKEQFKSFKNVIE
ncbi:MAG: radical SAM protein [Candidatus Omnitrophota bacterium]|nr:radical SAM protein [Candidatus Omnitrophota bacterium]